MKKVCYGLAGRLPPADSIVSDYNRFDEIAANPDVDIVYVTLPNSLHAGFVCRPQLPVNTSSVKTYGVDGGRL